MAALDTAQQLRSDLEKEYDARGPSVHQNLAARKLDAVIVMLKQHNDAVARATAAKAQGDRPPSAPVTAKLSK